MTTGCILVLMLAFPRLVFTQLPTIAWVGAPFPSSVRLALQPAAVSATLLVSRHRNLTQPIVTRTVTRDEFVVDVSGLIPKTHYYYGLAENALKGGRLAGEFHTASDSTRAPFRVAVGSCSWSRGNGVVFASIAALEPRPLMFIHAGDLHYQDIAENSTHLFEQAFQFVHAGEAAELFRSMPVVYTWDDHDFGGNNALMSSPSKAAAMTAFRKYVPATLSSEKDGAVYQSYEIQGVLFIVTDLRSQSDPSAATTLGAEQLSWLLGLLSQWRKWRLIVLVSSKPWLGLQDDGWGGYDAERLLISDHIAAVGVRNLIMVAGDAHMLAIDDGSNTDFSSVDGVAKGNASARAGFCLFQVAPLTGYGSSKSGPYSHGCVGNRFFVNHQFGIIDIDDGDSSNICVHFKGMTESGATVAMELKVCAGETDDGGVRGLVRKGTRTLNQGSSCSLPMAPTGMIVMAALGCLLFLVSVGVDVCICARADCKDVLQSILRPREHYSSPSASPTGDVYSTAHDVSAAYTGAEGSESHMGGLEMGIEPDNESRVFASRDFKSRKFLGAAIVCAFCHILAVVLVALPLALSLGPKQNKG